MTGAFAWNGLLGFYIPIVIWGVWSDGLAYYMRKDIKRRQAELDAEADPQLSKDMESVE